MAKKPKISVVLHPDVLPLLDGLKSLLRDGRYFNCDSVEHAGEFLQLEVTALDHRGKPYTSHISIPARYVLYMASAAPGGRKALGFQDDD